MMKPKQYILLIVIGVAIVAVYLYSQSSTKNETQKTYLPLANYDFSSIAELKQHAVVSGRYNTEGYVVKIFTCSPCPAGATCGLCMKNNIVISVHNSPLETYQLTDNELIIFTDNPEQFVLGSKYRFSVTVLDYKTTSAEMNDVELIGYELLE